MFEKGKNPRSNPGHRERGRVRIKFTWDDMANLFGLSARTLQNYAAKNLFDPEDLRSIVEFYNKRNKITD